ADVRTTPAGRRQLIAWAVPSADVRRRASAAAETASTQAASTEAAPAEAASADATSADATSADGVRADRGGTPGAAGRSALARGLRSFLADRLPPFMVPATIHVVDELPHNSNGKVDRRQLPDSRTRPAGPPPATKTERLVAEAWGDLLAVPDAGRDDDFFALGGGSLLAVRAVAAVRNRLAMPATHTTALLTLLLAGPTVRDFARAVDALAADSAPDGETVDFTAETRLGPEPRITTRTSTRTAPPAHILLTGATGFLGTHLLHRLLRRTTATVHCLVRADDTAHAERRLETGARRHGLTPDSTWQRVVAVPGDLTAPGFGLSPGAFDTLARTVDTVVHNAAQVNFAYPYTALRPANVTGTRTVLLLAATHGPKPVHYVSTVDTLGGDATAGRTVLDEDTPPQHPERLRTGYAQSKWVAEGLLRRAAARGLPVAVYRPYDISGPATGGVWPTNMLISALIKAIADTGTAPDARLPLDLVPVDHAADALVHLITHEPPDGRTYHLANPRPADFRLVVDRLRARGHTVRRLPAAEWLAAMAAQAAETPDAPLTPFLPMLTPPPGTDGLMDDLSGIRRDNADRALRRTGILCPPVDATLVDRCLDHLETTGFLHRAEERTTTG
ncbi:thioester reductase domain-containing protein, partial [Streptomyces clavuligerus]